MAKILQQPEVRLIPLLIVFLFLSSCTVPRQYILSNLETTPLYPLIPPPDLVLLINTYDIPRDKNNVQKQELFMSIADSVLVELSRQLRIRASSPSKIVFGVSKTNAPDDVRHFMNEHSASHCIAINNFDISFKQTPKESTEDGVIYGPDPDYDIISKINYTFYNPKATELEIPVTARRFHSTRSLLSELKSAGPNILNNGEDALAISKENVTKYLNYFLPGRAERYRVIFMGQELSKVNNAFFKGDYETALKESLLYINDADKKLAAKANLNCAVLLEHKQMASAAKSYLEKSLQRYALPEARTMMIDYGMQ